MSVAKAFIDTNIFVYLYSNTDADKRHRAFLIINKYNRVASTQVLNEFCNVALRKLGLLHANIRVAVNSIITSCDMVQVDQGIIGKALDLQEKSGYAYYDCLMIAAALAGGCQYLFSEDMQDGQEIEDITIINIFKNRNI